VSARAENIVADLRRFLDQQAEDGIERWHLDEAIAAQAREIFARRIEESGVVEAAEAADGLKAPEVADGARAPEVAGSAAAPTTSDTADNAAVLARLDREEVSVCTRCKLHEGRTKTVFGVGNPQADLVFVGEAPGRDEDLQGEPFVGMAGKLLTKILSAIGFEREDVYICNVLKCRPPQNRDPQPDEVAQCEPYLLRQLEILQPKVICALGRVAAQTLLQTRESLTRMRGRVHDYHGIPMMVTYHPAALLRNPNWKRPTWEDVQKLRALHDELVGGE
jgi:DNA polymerase